MLAKETDSEIISADSMQVYRHMDIGTAKITHDEMKGIRHHLIDILEPTEEYNVSRFKTEAKTAVDDIYKRGKRPIITGGTGFYIQALLYDVDFSDNAQTEYRKELFGIAEERGNEYLFEMLKHVDPKAASYLHANDLKRVTRALEYYKETGKRISEHNEQEHDKKPAYDFYYFVLNMPREQLYLNIDRRVDEMIKCGLVDEVKSLKTMGCNEDMVSMKGLGYKEILRYLNGELGLDEAVRIIKRDTRHFAKRQLTWFKRERDVIWINKDEFDNDESKITGFIMDKITKRELY
jgi:tRNA dimethylallyltransferase